MTLDCVEVLYLCMLSIKNLEVACYFIKAYVYCKVNGVPLAMQIFTVQFYGPNEGAMCYY